VVSGAQQRAVSRSAGGVATLLAMSTSILTVIDL
jgi:hypothetical protein